MQMLTMFILASYFVDKVCYTARQSALIEGNKFCRVAEDIFTLLFVKGDIIWDQTDQNSFILLKVKERIL